MFGENNVVKSLRAAFENGNIWSSKDISLKNTRLCHDFRLINEDNRQRDLLVIRGEDLREAIVTCVKKDSNPNNRYWIDGVHIIGDVNLQGLISNGWISINNSIFEGNLIAKHAHLGSLYLCNVYFDQCRTIKQSPTAEEKPRAFGLSAPGLKTSGGLRFGAQHAPLHLDYIDLRAAEIGGDTVIEATWLNTPAFDGYTLMSKSLLNTRNPEDGDIKQTTPPIFGVREKCAFYARGTNFKRNLRIASSIIIGEIRLTDAHIEKSFLIEGSVFANPENYLSDESTLNKLPLIEEYNKKLSTKIPSQHKKTKEYKRSAYSIFADRITINGRFSTSRSRSYSEAVVPYTENSQNSQNPCIFLGKIRMHGAKIHGAMYLTQAILSSNRRSAMSFSGASINGSISFSHSLVIAAEKYFGIVCRRANITGDFFVHDEETARNVTSPWKKVETFSQALKEQAPHQSVYNGLDLFHIPGFSDFLKLYEWYSLCRDEMSMHLNVTMSDHIISGKQPPTQHNLKERETRNWIPNGILLDNSTIHGRFTAKRAVIGYPRPDCTVDKSEEYEKFIQLTEEKRENRPIESIGAERTIIGHGVYLTNAFIAYGKINFRRSEVSGNFSLRYATIRTPSIKYSILDNISKGEHHLGYPESYKLNQSVNIGGLHVSGNLDLSGCLVEPMCAMQLKAETEERPKRLIEQSIAVYGSRSIVDGVVLLNNGISFRGSIKFHGSKIGGSFLFEPVLPPANVESKTFKECDGHDWRLDLSDAQIEKILSINLVTSGLTANDFRELITELNQTIRNARNANSSENEEPDELDLEENGSLTRHIEQVSIWLERRRPRHQANFLNRLNQTAKKKIQDKKTKEISHGRLDLVNAKSGSYSDDFHALGRNWILKSFSFSRIFPLQYTWPLGEIFTSWPDNTTLDLEGFQYNNFSGRGLDSRLGGSTRIEWLKHQYIASDPISNIAWIFPSGLWLLLLTLSIILDIPKEVILCLLFSFPIIISAFTISLFAFPIEVRSKISIFKARLPDIRRQGLKWHGYKSQPWLHCAATLRNSGREEAARRVRLSRERLILFSRKIYPFERLFRAILLLLFGRGLVRSYPVMWFTTIFFIAWFLYDLSFKSNLMRPSEPVVLIEMAEHASIGLNPTLPPPGYETPRAHVYAFERMTPGMPFTHENRWAACAPEHIAASEFNFFNSFEPDTIDPIIPLCFPTRTGFFKDALTASKNHSPLSNPYMNEISQEKIQSICIKKQLVLPDGQEKPIILSEPMRQLCNELRQEKQKMSILTEFTPSDTSPILRFLKKFPLANRVINRLDEFLKEGGARVSGWAFLSYGWLLVAGFAISISQLLLRAD